MQISDVTLLFKYDYLVLTLNKNSFFFFINIIIFSIVNTKIKLKCCHNLIITYSKTLSKKKIFQEEVLILKKDLISVL